MPRMYEQLPVSIQQSLRVPLAFKQKIFSVEWTSGSLHHKIPLSRLPLRSVQNPNTSKKICRNPPSKVSKCIGCNDYENHICHINTKNYISSLSVEHSKTVHSTSKQQLKAIKLRKSHQNTMCYESIHAFV